MRVKSTHYSQIEGQIFLHNDNLVSKRAWCIKSSCVLLWSIACNCIPQILGICEMWEMIRACSIISASQIGCFSTHCRKKVWILSCNLRINWHLSIPFWHIYSTVSNTSAEKRFPECDPSRPSFEENIYVDLSKCRQGYGV